MHVRTTADAPDSQPKMSSYGEQFRPWTLPAWKSTVSLKRCAMESMTTRRRGKPGGFWMKCSMRRSLSSRSSHVAMSRST